MVRWPRSPSACSPWSTYKPWAAARGAILKEWFAREGNASAWGQSKGKGADTAAWMAAAQAELAAAGGYDAFAAYIDCEKCYDHISLSDLAFQGCLQGISKLASLAAAQYTGQRYVRWAGALSKPINPTQGIPAGCPLANGMLHLFLLRAMKSTEDQARGARLRTYADDWKLFAQGMRRKAAHDIVGGFAAATAGLRRPGMVVSLTKSVISVSGGSARAVLRQVAGAFGAQVAIHVKDLGVDDTLAATKKTPAQRKRVRDAAASAARIARLPHGCRGRARLTASLSGNQSKWGVDVTGLPGHAAGRLRSAYLKAVSGGRAARRAPEVTLAVVAPGSFLDPALSHTHQVILSWAKRVAMDDSLVEWVAQAWSREVEQPSPPGKPRAPIALIVTQLRKLGWEPTEPAAWRQGTEPRNVFDLEGLRNHLDRALRIPFLLGRTGG